MAWPYPIVRTLIRNGAGITAWSCIAAGLLSIAATGCAGHGRSAASVPAWQSEDFVSNPAPAAPVAEAPPSAAPVPPTNPPAASASVPFSEFTETWIPLVRWCQAAGLPAPECQVHAQPGSYTLNTGGGEFLFRTGSRVAHWAGIELRLGYAPVLIDGQPYVHAVDIRKSVLPLIDGGSALPASPRPVLVLDPGHGGEDSGARCAVERGWEKQFTLDWACRVQALLEPRGWQVLLTRSNDCELALSNRVAFADQHHADLFVSLHFNSTGNDKVQAGLETYCLAPRGMPSTITRGYPDDLKAAFPNNVFDSQNLQLALRVHRSLLEINGHQDRGVRRARFMGVLRAQQRPAILIEGGYLSNPSEARRIADAGYRQKLAEAVAGALSIERTASSL